MATANGHRGAMMVGGGAGASGGRGRYSLGKTKARHEQLGDTCRQQVPAKLFCYRIRGQVTLAHTRHTFTHTHKHTHT